ncbi:MAG TPA: hypothetical protein VGC92_09660 [Phenylobacterium sp.]
MDRRIRPPYTHVMSDGNGHGGPTNADILAAIKGLGQHLGKLEARLENVETAILTTRQQVRLVRDEIEVRLARFALDLREDAALIAREAAVGARTAAFQESDSVRGEVDELRRRLEALEGSTR